jgi:hypothetical protein
MLHVGSVEAEVSTTQSLGEQHAIADVWFPSQADQVEGLEVPRKCHAETAAIVGVSGEYHIV